VLCYNIHLFQEEDEEDEEDDEGEQSFHAKNFVSYMQKIIFIA
jgi:hypothetical protein